MDIKLRTEKSHKIDSSLVRWASVFEGIPRHFQFLQVEGPVTFVYLNEVSHSHLCGGDGAVHDVGGADVQVDGVVEVGGVGGRRTMVG